MPESIINLDQIKDDFLGDLNACRSQFDVHQLKSSFTGKKSIIATELKKIPQLPPEERKTFGRLINELKVELLQLIDDKLTAIEAQQIQDAINHEKIDVTLPLPSHSGTVHPVSAGYERLAVIMQNMGFELRENNEIETDYFNFTGLNIPDHHPARQEQDTFYTTDGRLLRTHTSSVQVHVMNDEKPPIRIICPGRVFRNDQDKTHAPMFHQLECLCIDKHVNMAMLLDTIRRMLAEFFEREIEIRLRPNYFPFTEPSAEVDIKFNGKWLEVLGCGMVHPNVLNMANIDTTSYRGFAFGVGIDRLVMLKYGIDDLRNLFNNHPGFISQFTE